MIQFYAPDIAETLQLPESDSGHCVRVLRMSAGDVIYAVDGKGHRMRCVITEANHKHTTVEIADIEEVPKYWKGNITVAVAPPKNIERFEWFLEKAVETGVDRVVPLRCARSERKDIRPDRLNRIMVSAMKQSLKARLPRLDAMTGIDDFLKNVSGQLFMGYCSPDAPRRPFVKNFKPGSDVTILIGPEGDFTPSEVDRAVAAGFVPVTFGECRLRTETAALFALTAVHVIGSM